MKNNDLYRLSENDLKIRLDKNKYFNKGALILYDNKIYEIVFRFNTTVVVKNIQENYGKVTKKILELSDEVELLTIEKFNELKLKNISNILYENIENTIKYINITLKKAFGNNYEVILYEGSRNIEVIILFPQIEVKNSLDLTHTMSDVYLKLVFCYYYGANQIITLYLNDFSLYRGKYSKEELSIGYMFSHISGSAGLEKFQNEWCLGNTGFRTYINNLKQHVNILDIVFIILQFKAYLSWESIEGTPYKYIVNIRHFNKIPIILQNIMNINYNEIYIRVLKRLGNFKYSIGIDNFSYKANLDEASVDKIRTIASKLYPELCFYLIDNTSVEIGKIDYDISKFRYSNYYFKGNQVIPEIIPNKKTMESLENIEKQFKKTIHVDILDYIVSRIESDFIEYYLKNKLK